MTCGAHFELVDLVAKVAQPTQRVEATAALCRYLGVEAALGFVLDEEVGIFLSALGFPQTLPDGLAWQRYLTACAQGKPDGATLPFPPDNRVLPLTGLAWNGQVVLVLGGPRPESIKMAVLTRLLPLLAVSLLNEHLVRIQSAQVGVARRTAEEAKSLAEGLDNARRAAQKEIIARKNAEKALLQLGDELTKSNAELRRARDAAMASASAKDDFLAALSHELRTPLNPVLLVAGDAAENTSLPPQVRADFAMIAKNVELEARLIDDLLDLTRISRGKMQFERKLVNLNHVLQDSIALLRPEIMAQELSFRTQLSPHQPVVVGDAVRLQQIFWNVIRNAVKFTPAGGSISLTQTVNLVSRMVTIQVKDSGIGLTAAEIDRIFEAFTQGEHAAAGGSHRFGGLGLGLAISKKLAELHGGQIRVSSPGLGQGATFSIELPYALPDSTRAGQATDDADTGRASAAPASSDCPDHNERLHILLVEDHVPSRDVVCALLRKRRYEVYPAGSVADALDLATRNKFDLIISDFGLPDGNGSELLTALRAAQPNLKGIALSGYGMDADVASTQAYGFSVHLVKPVSMRELDRAITSLVHGTCSATLQGTSD